MSIPEHCLSSPPWSGKRLRRLGECIRDGLPHPDDPTYADVMIWYNDLALAVQDRIRATEWTTLGLRHPPEVTSRAKTIDTLREKLRRDRNTPLPNIQDVAGVRLEAEMTLTQQDRVAGEIARIFDADATCVKDIRATPHSGYRALHVWLRLPAGRVEIQVRTHLQGQWANMYESFADLAGREVRYGALPQEDGLRRATIQAQALSTENGASLERWRDSLAGQDEAIQRLRGVMSEVEENEGSGSQAVRDLRADLDELEEEHRVDTERMSTLEARL